MGKNNGIIEKMNPHTHAHTHMHMHTHTALTHAHAHTHSTHTRTCTHIQMHTHTHMHTAHTHICTHTHTRTHTHQTLKICLYYSLFLFQPISLLKLIVHYSLHNFFHNSVFPGEKNQHSVPDLTWRGNSLTG